MKLQRAYEFLKIKILGKFSDSSFSFFRVTRQLIGQLHILHYVLENPIERWIFF